MVKILVSNPPWPGEGWGGRTATRWPHRRADKLLAFPIYLSYLIAYLNKKGFETKGIDAVEKGMGIQKFTEYISEYKPDIVLMEVSTPSIMYDLETAVEIKKKTGAIIIFWGPHASYFHDELIRYYTFIDACIRQEPELVMENIANAVENKVNFYNIKGLTSRNEKNEVIINELERQIDLDELPFPDREYFKIENYQQGFYSGKKCAIIKAHRGCPFRCTFCLWPDTLYGHNLRTRNVKNVVDEIEHLIKYYNVDEVFFDDDTFTANKKYVIDICNDILLRKLNIMWLCLGSVQTVDKEVLDIMKKAGCTQVFYGFESADQNILNEIKKNITLDQMKLAVKLTQKAGMIASGSFVIGLPSDNSESLNKMINFARELKADFVQFVMSAPYPGTVLYEESKKENLIDIDYWGAFDYTSGPIMRTRYLSKQQLNGLTRKMYLKYYTSPGIILINLYKFYNLKNIRRIFTGMISVIKRLLFYKK